MSDHERINDPKEALEIQNVVASTAIGQELDLQSVAIDLEGVDFDPDQFPGLVYRIQDPQAAALIFRSGKIVCTGAKSVPDVHEALEVAFELNLYNETTAFATRRLGELRPEEYQPLTEDLLESNYLSTQIRSRTFFETLE